MTDENSVRFSRFAIQRPNFFTGAVDGVRAVSCGPTALVMKSPEWQEHRRKVGWEVAAENGSISEFGRRVGIQPQTACKWLNDHDAELHEALRENAQAHNVLPREQRLSRLLTYRDAIASGMSHTKASKECGISQNRMRIWLQLWAPDGVEMAIEDETDCEADVWQAA